MGKSLREPGRSEGREGEEGRGEKVEKGEEWHGEKEKVEGKGREQGQVVGKDGN